MRWFVFALTSLHALTAWAQATGGGVLGVGVEDPPEGGPLHGAWVRKVAPNSAASAAGVRVNDIVIAVDGQPLRTAADLPAFIGRLRAGQRVALQVVRMSPAGARQLRLDATLGGSTATPPDRDAPAAVRDARPSPPSQPEHAGAQPAAAPIPADVHWITYTEPGEHAYTVDVPRGWHVAGSIERRAELGASPYLRLMSPDRQLYIVLGDPTLTLFTTPLRSPSTRPAWQGQVVLPYVSSQLFARDYATQTLSKVCGDLKTTGERDRPELTRGRWASMNPTARHSGGEVAFSCRRNGAEMHGAVLVENYIYARSMDMGGAIWSVDLLAASLAPPDRDAAARAMTMHVAESLRFEAQFVQQEKAKSDAVTAGVNAATDVTRRTGEGAVASAQRKMQATLRQGEEFSRVLNGHSPYVDSAGRHYDLDNTKTWWTDGDGHIRATDGAPPGPGSQKLQEVPPE